MQHVKRRFHTEHDRKNTKCYKILNVIKFYLKKGKYCQKEFDFLKKSEKLHIILNPHRNTQ